jgi:hypothetical protein
MVAGAVEVEERLDDLTHVRLARAFTGPGRRDQRRQDGLLSVCQVRQIPFVRGVSHGIDLWGRRSDPLGTPNFYLERLGLRMQKRSLWGSPQAVRFQYG